MENGSLHTRPGKGYGCSAYDGREAAERRDHRNGNDQEHSGVFWQASPRIARPSQLANFFAVCLGLDEADSTKSTLDVYRFSFERPFLEATTKYYQAESKQFVAENSVVEYMKKVCSFICTDIIEANYD